MAERAESLVLRTPEGVAFALRLAGPASRALAWLIDAACIAALLGGVAGLLRLVTVVHLDLGTALILVVNHVVGIGYGILLEWFWRGQTLGKRLLGLRVTDRQGLRLQFSQVVIRNLLRAIDSLPLFYLTGGLAALCSRHYQRLGDLAANTVVIRAQTPPPPDLEPLLGSKYNSLRDDPLLAARLRQKVSPELAQLALRAVGRRDLLEPAARVALFRELAVQIRGLVHLPAEALEGQTDERLVRNVLDVVCRNGREGRGETVGSQEESRRRTRQEPIRQAGK